ncbi:MAG: MAPEG family protein [Gammaproteobacteria bacterium]|jgi:uncharacterized MAPEG superfamily protein|nr:MAPEG family protein [Gammaproteobacteria bacterium]
MEATVIVTFLVLAQYVLFGIQVGEMRSRYGVKGPAITGHDEFERMNRVHQNTMEQLVLFLPALWIHAQYANPLWGAGLALVFIAGRFIYRAEYLKDPNSRSPGFSMSFIPSAILLIWALVVAVTRLL